jgi:hypothetical protein
MRQKSKNFLPANMVERWLSDMECFLLPANAKTILDEAKAYDGGLPGRNKHRHTNRGRSQ